MPLPAFSFTNPEVAGAAGLMTSREGARRHRTSNSARQCVEAAEVRDGNVPERAASSSTSAATARVPRPPAPFSASSRHTTAKATAAADKYGSTAVSPAAPAVTADARSSVLHHASSPRRHQQQLAAAASPAKTSPRATDTTIPLSPRSGRAIPNEGATQRARQQQTYTPSTSGGRAASLKVSPAFLLPRVPLAAAASAQLSPIRLRQLAAAGLSEDAPLALLASIAIGGGSGGAANANTKGEGRGGGGDSGDSGGGEKPVHSGAEKAMPPNDLSILSTSAATNAAADLFPHHPNPLSSSFTSPPRLHSGAAQPSQHRQQQQYHHHGRQYRTHASNLNHRSSGSTATTSSGCVAGAASPPQRVGADSSFSSSGAAAAAGNPLIISESPDRHQFESDEGDRSIFRVSAASATTGSATTARSNYNNGNRYAKPHRPQPQPNQHHRRATAAPIADNNNSITNIPTTASQQSSGAPVATPARRQQQQQQREGAGMASAPSAALSPSAPLRMMAMMSRPPQRARRAGGAAASWRLVDGLHIGSDDEEDEDGEGSEGGDGEREREGDEARKTSGGGSSPSVVADGVRQRQQQLRRRRAAAADEAPSAHRRAMLFRGGARPNRLLQQQQQQLVGGSSPSGVSGDPSAASPSSVRSAPLRTFDKNTGQLVRINSAMYTNAKLLSREQYMVNRADPSHLAEAARRVAALPFTQQVALAERRFYRGARARVRGRLGRSGGLDLYAMTWGDGGGGGGGGGGIVVGDAPSPALSLPQDGASTASFLPTSSSSSAAPSLLGPASTTATATAMATAPVPSIFPSTSALAPASAAVHHRSRLEAHIALGDVAGHMGTPTASVGANKLSRAAIDQFIFEACQLEADRHLAILTNNLLPEDLAPVELLRLQLDAFRHRCVPVGPQPRADVAGESYSSWGGSGGGGGLGVTAAASAPLVGAGHSFASHASNDEDGAASAVLRYREEEEAAFSGFGSGARAFGSISTSAAGAADDPTDSPSSFAQPPSFSRR